MTPHMTKNCDYQGKIWRRLWLNSFQDKLKSTPYSELTCKWNNDFTNFVIIYNYPQFKYNSNSKFSYSYNSKLKYNCNSKFTTIVILNLTTVVILNWQLM